MSHGTGTESAPNAFALEVLRRLPLAEAFHTVWGYVAADPVLDDLFDRHRGRCCEVRLTFAELVRVLADALTRYRGHGRGAILDAVERNQISCQVRAVYLKLSRLPLPLAEAFLTALTQRLRPLFPATARPAALPASLGGLWVVVVDGKKVKRVAKRLLEDAKLTVAERGFMLFVPWRAEILDRTLARVPLGAQYYVAATATRR